MADYAQLLDTHERLIRDYNAKDRDYNTLRENYQISIRQVNKIESQLEACQNNLEECTKLISGLRYKIIGYINQIAALNTRATQAEAHQEVAIAAATKARSDLERERRSV